MITKKECGRVARSYAKENRWAVFPVYNPVQGRVEGRQCSCSQGGKCPNPGKHPRTPKGHKDATTDERLIHEWWEKWPDAHVGVRTGIGSGIIVLDVDSPKGGDDSLAALEKEFGSLPATLEAATGGGGRHFVFKHPGGIIKNKTGFLRGLDVRGDGGYIVAPPSNHVSGGAYEWVNQLPPAPPPAWLMDLILDSKPPVTKVDREPSPKLIAEGERNTTLTSIAGRFRRVGLDEEGLYAKLETVNRRRCIPPLTPDELRVIAKSVAQYEPNVANYTDLGNAIRFAARHGHDLRYVHKWKKWITWAGTRWRIDDSGAVERLAKDTVRAMHVEAAEEADSGPRKKKSDWAIRSETANRMRDMIRLAQSEDGIPVAPDDLDFDPWLLNVQNGTLDLHTGKLRGHLRGDLCTKQVPTKYVPEAKCPRWLKFMDDITCEDKELKLFLQRAVGYSLTGDTTEQVFFILHGFGANGKTTFTKVIQQLLGNYAVAADPGTFLTKRSDPVSNDIARLHGARFVSAQEVEDGRHLAESLVKQVTGGDKITARKLYTEHFEFTPHLKLFLSTNHKPNIYGTDNAIWRRIRLIPFKETFGPGRVKKKLSEKLVMELEGILAWAVRGCLDWQKKGLGESPAVDEATSTYRKEMDVLGAFIDERCVNGGDAECPASSLFAAYRDWCEVNGHKPASQRTLGMRLKERGYTPARLTGGRRKWVGLTLRPGSEPAGGEF